MALECWSLDCRCYWSSGTGGTGASSEIPFPDENHGDTANDGAIGDVEVGPDPFLFTDADGATDEVTYTSVDDPVVQVADRSGGDESQRHNQHCWSVV